MSMDIGNVTGDRSNNVCSNTTRHLEPSMRMLRSRSIEVNPFSQPINFDRLKSERARLETFFQPVGWPVSFISQQDCANAGFFFLRDGDKVQCAFCRGVTGDWVQGDNPLTEHRRHFPRCPFICGLPVGNIPLDTEETREAVLNNQQDAAGWNVHGAYAIDLSQLNLNTAQPVSVEITQQLVENENVVVTGVGIKTCGNGPAFRCLVTVPSRMKTFTNWPTECGQTPEIMAEAGFFYIGQLDNVKCFYCNGGIHNWDASHDPWLEHARWFPKCTYVILNKGDKFVKEASRVKPPKICHFQQQRPFLTNGNHSRIVSEQELQQLIDTPIVQTALEIGMELGKVKRALQRKIQQTRQPFHTTQALLEAVLGQDLEYESGVNSNTYNIEEDWNLNPTSPSCPQPNSTSNSTNRASSNDVGYGSSTEASSSSFSSLKHSKDTDLQEEVRKLKEKISCKICMDNEIGIVFIPCRHLIACTSCATALAICALCRQPIKSVLRTFMS